MKKFWLTLLIILNATPLAYAFEKSFYILRDTQPTNVIKNHSHSIDVLISQAYHINASGKVSGSINPRILSFAENHHTKLMALVTNSEFDNHKAHLFLADKSAQEDAIQSLLQYANENHLYGVQFDFEGVDIADKHALTDFFSNAAKVFHQHGFVVSYAIIPSFPDITQQTDYQKRKYQHWSGVYNLTELAKFADFVTIMTYDQHQPGTTPGPTASIQWVEAAINYTTKYIPKNKLSLGIPTYSGYWHLGGLSNHHISVNLEDINYNQVMSIMKKNHATLHWDNANKVNYAIFQKNWMNEYMFVEDARSFKAKLHLAKEHGLRGISVFDIGYEDPAIWNTFKV